MSSWSRNRKSLYGGVVIVVLCILIAIPSYRQFYKKPTCFDGVKNGNEQGVDCGGSCVRLCQSAFMNAQVAWTRFEEVAPGLFNAAAYIINPNTEGEAIGVPYHIVLYDKDGVIIVDRTGAVTLPPHRNVLAFQGAISVGKRVPAKALFEFTSFPNWHRRMDPLSKITVSDKNYAEEGDSSSLSVTLNNGAVAAIPNVSVYAVLYDANGNALGFSKTVVDEIPSFGSAVAPFTWPISRDGKVVSVEILPVQE